MPGDASIRCNRVPSLLRLLLWRLGNFGRVVEEPVGVWWTEPVGVWWTDPVGVWDRMDPVGVWSTLMEPWIEPSGSWRDGLVEFY